MISDPCRARPASLASNRPSARRAANPLPANRSRQGPSFSPPGRPAAPASTSRCSAERQQVSRYGSLHMPGHVVSAMRRRKLSFVPALPHFPAMIPALASALMPLVRLADAERAHGLGLTALRLGLAGCDRTPQHPRLAVRALGLDFRNPIGLAAGFDKNATAVAPAARLGFGFIETGTVTPLPQAGNPRPRLFRLEADAAVINRMGFNNDGLAAYLPRLAAGRAAAPTAVPVGANVGINKEGADPERDYPALVAAVAPHADYVVINVSSPNTPGLRDLQGEARLRAILEAVRQAVPKRPPLLVKIAPDLSEAGLEAVVAATIEGGAEGMIVSNTTISRPPGLRSPRAGETGGLSGAPLFELSTDMLRRAAALARGRLVLIGSGGVATGRDALAKLCAGATLVQVYTAMVYHGPALIGRIRRELLAALDAHGFATAADAVGADLR
jgi:dihydroorotate dehydrogenase